MTIGLVGLLDLPIAVLRDDATTSSGELVIALIVGSWLLVFALSALHHGRAHIDAGLFSFLAFGPWCRTERVRLADVVRYGHGTEKHRYRRSQILLLDLQDGERRSTKVSMYAD